MNYHTLYIASIMMPMSTIMVGFHQSYYAPINVLLDPLLDSGRIPA